MGRVVSDAWQRPPRGPSRRPYHPSLRPPSRLAGDSLADPPLPYLLQLDRPPAYSLISQFSFLFSFRVSRSNLRTRRRWDVSGGKAIPRTSRENPMNLPS